MWISENPRGFRFVNIKSYMDIHRNVHKLLWISTFNPPRCLNININLDIHNVHMYIHSLIHINIQYRIPISISNNHWKTWISIKLCGYPCGRL